MKSQRKKKSPQLVLTPGGAHVQVACEVNPDLAVFAAVLQQVCRKLRDACAPVGSEACRDHSLGKSRMCVNIRCKDHLNPANNIREIYVHLSLEFTGDPVYLESV